ncbi:MAG: DNA alkylation repair protein, partial [Pirellulaceae bacterium]
MKTVNEVMSELKKLGTEQTRKTFARHGAPVDKMFGVKVGDMKVILKKIKGNQKLAMDLYATGNTDAMYLAGLVADGALMSKKEIETWAKEAFWQMNSDFTVPWVACENAAGVELANKWIKSKETKLATTGWMTYASIVSNRPDEELDLGEIDSLLEKAVKEIHKVHDRVRYAMNNFVICVGSYVKPLSARAKAAAKKIGVVNVDMGDTNGTVVVFARFRRRYRRGG